MHGCLGSKTLADFVTKTLQPSNGPCEHKPCSMPEGIHIAWVAGTTHRLSPASIETKPRTLRLIGLPYEYGFE